MKDDNVYLKYFLYLFRNKITERVTRDYIKGSFECNETIYFWCINIT